jgi:hypothetical protein
MFRLFQKKRVGVAATRFSREITGHGLSFVGRDRLPELALSICACQSGATSSDEWG